MNYYIKGDKERAEEIKAAFEKKGVGLPIRRSCSDDGLIYFLLDGEVFSITIKAIELFKKNPDYKKLELPIEPKFKFKVGDWIVQNDNGTVSQITKVINSTDEYGEYRAYEHTNGYFHTFFEKEFHLWTIQDAKDGDILSAKIDGDGYILIFKQIKDGWIETYGHYYITIDKFCVPTQMFCRNYQGRLYPATQEQYKTLFKKMHDDGYEWYFDKKELRKIKPHYDIANFKPFDKVLVRDRNNEKWRCAWFSDYEKTLPFPFITTGADYKQCIPYEGNEHLLGTTDMCPEEYINW